MATVEDGVVRFDSKDERKWARQQCGECVLNIVCGGADEKTNSAVIYGAISFNPTDHQISENASCLKKN
jgi:hypothetical protein